MAPILTYLVALVTLKSDFFVSLVKKIDVRQTSYYLGIYQLYGDESPKLIKETVLAQDARL